MGHEFFVAAVISPDVFQGPGEVIDLEIGEIARQADVERITPAVNDPRLREQCGYYPQVQVILERLHGHSGGAPAQAGKALEIGGHQLVSRVASGQQWSRVRVRL